MTEFARILISIGISLAVVGGLILLFSRIFPQLGNLPGDFSFESENVKFYFPLATMILISIIGTILLNIFQRFFK